MDLPDFLLVQVQEYGSYRSEDVVEALNWMLPIAKNSRESIIVLLDWYSGHRTEEVRELMRRKRPRPSLPWRGDDPFHASK